MNKRRLVVANWKMYIDSPESARRFATALRKKSRLYKGVDVVLAPAFPLLAVVAEKLKGSVIRLGAQTISEFEDAPHTGDVSAAMLKHAGVSFVIVGHSERRAQNETDAAVHAQLERALLGGLSAILCVGEKERDVAGSHFSLIESQLAVLKNLPHKAVSKIIVAYEPVWAIGKTSAEAMKGSDLREMSIFIKKTLAEQFDRVAALKVPILYGGSVEPGNAHSLMAEGDINGFLVGHASAEIDQFLDILKAIR
ncbi:MAG: triose-phosphate isomerase [Patescibacteria group bacterium]|nr:triose-phosphate isomerase [Patescibacteria group bacterium]